MKGCIKHITTFPCVVISGNLSFVFDRPIKCKTVKYILTNRTATIGVYSVLIPKDLVDLLLIGRLKYGPDVDHIRICR